MSILISRLLKIYVFETKLERIRFYKTGLIIHTGKLLFVISYLLLALIVLSISAIVVLAIL